MDPYQTTKSLALLRCTLYLLCLLPAASTVAQDKISGFDYYGPLAEWQHDTGLDVAPIHAGLLPNGKLYFLNVYKFGQYAGRDLTAADFQPEYMFLMDAAPAYEQSPATIAIQPLVSPLPPGPSIDPDANTVSFKTLTCSAHALTADGELFFASGTNPTVDLTEYAIGNYLESLTVDGIQESVTYNPFTDSWTQNPDMIGAAPQSGLAKRWYATVTRLADARILVTGGYEKVVPHPAYNNSVEIFDPASNAWSLVSDQLSTPVGLENPDYTHVFQYPYSFPFVDPETGVDASFNITLMLGGSGEPIYLFNNDRNQFWFPTGNYRPGAKEFLDAKAPEKVFPNHGASTVLLPLRLPEDNWGYANGSLMVASGAHFTPLEESVDIYDVGTHTWLPSLSMGGLRHHNSTVLLPDGRVLILGGHDNTSEVKRTGYAQYLDPKNGFTLLEGRANMPEVRGYHAVAVLLPDGRVLVGGGNPGGSDGYERTDFRYYYPDYMFKPRPGILYVDELFGFDDDNLMFVPHQTDVSEAALVGLGSMTHSFDMNQRHVQVRVVDPGVTIKVEADRWVAVDADACTEAGAFCIDAYFIQGPELPEIAPPGHYTLFILDEDRVPSFGKIVKVE